MFEERAARAWLDDLNGAQRAAVTHAGGPLLILAGAGTGKTTTLCSRMAWLLAEGIPAERILLLTFTRRAARASGPWACSTSTICCSTGARSRAMRSSERR